MGSGVGYESGGPSRIFVPSLTHSCSQSPSHSKITRASFALRKQATALPNKAYTKLNINLTQGSPLFELNGTCRWIAFSCFSKFWNVVVQLLLSPFTLSFEFYFHLNVRALIFFQYVVFSEITVLK